MRLITKKKEESIRKLAFKHGFYAGYYSAPHHPSEDVYELCKTRADEYVREKSPKQN